MQLPEGASLISGSASGACLVIVGGVHGDEPVGARAIDMTTALVGDERWRVTGTVFGLIGNPRASGRSVRFVDENLNRAFGADTAGSYEAGRARELRTWFGQLAHAYGTVQVIDLHSVSVGETRMVIFNADSERGRASAARSPIPLHLGYREASLPGSLIGAIEQLGGVGLAIECGNHSSETGLTVALEHIEDALEGLGMLERTTVSFRGKIPYEGERRTYTLLSPIKPANGFAFTIPVASETLLRAGQVFAHDETGDHRAPSDAYIMMPSKNPRPDDFDAGFLAIRD